MKKLQKCNKGATIHPQTSLFYSCSTIKNYNSAPIDAYIMTENEPIKYRTVYADPPWMERGGGKIKRGADRHYPLMKTKDIKALPVSQMAEENAHLYLWVTNNFLKDGLEVMEAWGFRYVTMVTWAKDRIGLGQYFRGQTEHILFGVKGSLPYKTDEQGKRQQGTTLLTAKRLEHSRKPEEFRQLVEKVSYGPYVELFARRPAEGWHVWGNQVETDIILDGTNNIGETDAS